MNHDIRIPSLNNRYFMESLWLGTLESCCSVGKILLGGLGIFGGHGWASDCFEPWSISAIWKGPKQPSKWRLKLGYGRDSDPGRYSHDILLKMHEMLQGC